MIFDWLRDNDLLPACLADANPNRALPDRPVEGHVPPYMTIGTVRSDRPAGILSLTDSGFESASEPVARQSRRTER